MKIIAKNKEHLQEIIKNEIDANGNDCDLNHIDVSQVTNMSTLFLKSSFIGNISQWDVSNVKNMNNMFYYSNFNGDISNWDVSNVEKMDLMFCKSIFNNDISKWNTANVKSMSGMFWNSVFNNDISNWDVSKVKDMSNMFRKSLFRGDISNWNVRKTESMVSMFNSAKLNNGQDLIKWKPYEANINDMFSDCVIQLPYWSKHEDLEDRKKAIDEFSIYLELNKELTTQECNKKKLKI
jgi:hypothetical protein